MQTLLIVTFNGNLYECVFDGDKKLTDTNAAKSLKAVMDVNDGFNQWKESELTIKSVVNDENSENFFDYVEVESSNYVVQSIIDAHKEHEPLNSDDAVFQHSMTTLAILRKFAFRSKPIEE